MGGEGTEAVIVIPTYNEKDNLRPLVEEILRLPRRLRIVIVDDNSPDGTGQVADELAAQMAEVQVIHRSGKGGRGSACLAGFRYALQETEAPLILEMDADFSHHPRYIPELLDKARQADVVIGSRYLRDSRIVDWGLRRRIFSRLANLFARTMLGVPIADYTNGFRCYRREVLEALDLDSIQTTGYIVLSETALRLHKAGARFAEIPTVFVNRKRGQSNTTLSEIVDAFAAVWRLRRRYARAQR
ncbi:MAG: polyprenol monophosphomannose synthase [Anaerolineae bacterium]|nr:polyprenol monophosphomannose synthase [Anaerolineae bacterium]